MPLVHSRSPLRSNAVMPPVRPTRTRPSATTGAAVTCSSSQRLQRSSPVARSNPMTRPLVVTYTPSRPTAAANTYRPFVSLPHRIAPSERSTA